MCKVRTFSQMNQEERIRIETMLEARYKQSEIVKRLNLSESTISRELRRNIGKRGRGAKKYCAVRAQSKTEHRHRTKPKVIKLTEEIKCKIKDLITHSRFSPDLIS